MRFSKSTQCFYPTDINYSNLPADIVSCSVADFDLAMNRPIGWTLDWDTVNLKVVIVPAPSKTVLQAQQEKIASLESSYDSAIQVSVSFTSAGGVTKLFQADWKSQEKLDRATQGYNLAGSVPAGFYWVAEDNTRVPFTLADLKGLYSVMLSQGWTAFQNMRNKKDSVNAATTVAQVGAIVW